MDRPRKRLNRPLDSIIIHFDAFYASVVEAETPSLRSRPLAIQQKQIVVTCNYEARRRGLYKLQLIKEAKKICPDVVIVLGEDLTRFRNASKELYAFLRSFSWNSRCERLGFDEVGTFHGFFRQLPSSWQHRHFEFPAAKAPSLVYAIFLIEVRTRISEH
ncbi:uncharacterized protein N0V89_004226 [Didymosphaeria variabile]|uniref:UmuC domain-containing protein n=1 Tax=Didymosphaeria variabile TaxID=1932322 RepID=A0A9W8XRF8_9PLEO|nr:uncharacterized protein N0V89_004226 [Didymosphaeria variabile]KAJ4356196.1 hypothetical protein N0V89_004226 [Didymosphaeria variabile]